MKNSVITAVFAVAWSAVTVLGVLWGSTFDWPDNVHIDYGVPLVWATHTLITIAGPTDIWRVDMQALLADLLLWLGLMVLGLAVVARLGR